MSDGDHLKANWELRHWGSIAIIAAANIVATGLYLGFALLVLWVLLHALDWLGALSFIG